MGDDLLQLSLAKHLGPELANPDVKDICVNRPGEVFVRTSMGWQPVIAKPELTFRECKDLATYIAAHAGRNFDKDKTLLSARLPGGERVFIVHPPSAERNTVVICIRRQTEKFRSLDMLLDGGLLDMVRPAATTLRGFEVELKEIKAAAEEAALRGDFKRSRPLFKQFFQLGIDKRLNFVMSGGTGVGKTTTQNAVIALMNPRHRIVTLEDARELILPNHSNRVHLLYETDGGESKATIGDLMKGVLRMIPTCIISGELRGAEAWEYLLNVSSDHPGTVTTIHSDSIEGAFNMLMVRMRQHKDCTPNYSDAFLRSILDVKVDVVAQFKLVEQPSGEERPQITELYYEPERKYRLVD